MKAWSIIRTVITWVLILAAVLMVFFTLFSVLTMDSNKRSLFGVRLQVVLSDSMKATDFQAGDLAISTAVDPATLQEGDIVTFSSPFDYNRGEVMTHKIRSITTTDSGEPAFVTYGTSTNTDDSGLVPFSSVLGKYQFHIPKLGSFFQFVKSPSGYFFFILIPFSALILFQIFHIWRLFCQLLRERREEQEEQRQQLQDSAVIEAAALRKELAEYKARARLAQMQAQEQQEQSDT